MKRRATPIFFCAIMIIMFLSCSKIDYYDDDQVAFDSTLVLGHHGSSLNGFRPNTLASCIYALQVSDGVEVDVEISKDHTMWLSHDPTVNLCDGSKLCFEGTTDAEIEQVDSCNGADISYTKLEDLMKYMDDNNIRKTISIDVKEVYPCGAGTLDIEGIERLEVEQVIALADQYHLTSHLLFECQFISVLAWAEKLNSSVGSFYYSFGNLERPMLVALENNFDGLSCKAISNDTLNTDWMHLLHKKGLKVIAWNIPDNAYADYLKSIQADFLEVDF